MVAITWSHHPESCGRVAALPTARLPAPARYRRRRLAALAALAVVSIVAVGLAAWGAPVAGGWATSVVNTEPAAVPAGPGGGAGPAAGAGVARPLPEAIVSDRAGSSVYVVQPGDTLWSIARRLDGGSDPRPTVDRLAELNGGAALEAGQRLRIGP